MTEYFATDLVGIIYELLPGFVAAWIFHSLTDHSQGSPFERVVQALIFTAIVRAVVYPLQQVLFFAGMFLKYPVPWTKDTDFFLSVLLAVATGLLFSACANTNAVHSRLPPWLTKRTSFATQWYIFLYGRPSYVILHLKNGLRLHGWPEHWPDKPDKGHFVLMDASWLTPDNKPCPIPLTERILIPAAQVTMIEQEKDTSLWTEEDLRANERSSAEIAALYEQTKGADSAVDTLLKMMQDTKPKTTARRKKSGSKGDSENLHAEPTES